MPFVRVHKDILLVSFIDGRSLDPSSLDHLGPYPNSAARGRQRGRFSYNRRGGGHRPSHRGRNHHNHYQQQQHDYEASGDNGNPTTHASNRSFNRYFRPNMLEDPWLYLQPQKAPSHGQSLIFDSVNH